jgi:hypothetical protein
LKPTANRFRILSFKINSRNTFGIISEAAISTNLISFCGHLEQDLNFFSLIFYSIVFVQILKIIDFKLDERRFFIDEALNKKINLKLW